MQIDVKAWICANFQLLNYNFYYKCNYDQGWLVLHLARINRVFKNLTFFS